MNSTNMKNLFFFFCIMLLGIQVYGKVLTVSNRPNSSAPYKTVPDAIAAATAGDTLYIQGSETSYGNIIIDKRLTIIGPGHNPQKELALTAQFGSVDLGLQNLAVNGSFLIGLKVNSIQAYSFFQHNITIKRCEVPNIQAYDREEGINKDWIIENNILGRVMLSSAATNANNFIIRNNIINNDIHGTNDSVITNNIFLQSGNNAFTGVFHSIIQNNIFYGSNPSGTYNSTFNNNITFSSPNPELPYGTNNGNDNKVNVDPKFISYPGTGFSYDHDYHLQASSPGANAGTDGTDVGIYGGMGFSETGEPPIPVVRAFAIQNGVLAPGGKLKIKISAEAKN